MLSNPLTRPRKEEVTTFYRGISVAHLCFFSPPPQLLVSLTSVIHFLPWHPSLALNFSSFILPGSTTSTLFLLSHSHRGPLKNKLNYTAVITNGGQQASQMSEVVAPWEQMEEIASVSSHTFILSGGELAYRGEESLAAGVGSSISLNGCQIPPTPCWTRDGEKAGLMAGFNGLPKVEDGWFRRKVELFRQYLWP